MTKPHWLEITESVALAGSVLGTIAVAGTQQVLYAAVPLTVSVSLNLVNRQRLYQLNQRRSEEAVAQVYDSLQPLNQRFDRLESSKQQANSQTEERIRELQESLRDELFEAIAQVEESFPVIPEVPTLEPIIARINALESQLEQQRDRIEAQKLELKDSLRQENETAIARIHQALESLPPFPNLKPLADRLEQLETATEQVNQETERQIEAFTKSLWEQTEKAVGQIYQSLATLPTAETLTTLSDRLSQLELTTNAIALSSSQESDTSSTSAAVLQDAIQSLSNSPKFEEIYQRLQQLETLTPQQAAPEIQEIQATLTRQNQEAIARVNTVIEAVTQRLDRLETASRAIPSPLPELQTLSSPPPDDSNANQPPANPPTPESPSEPPRVPSEYRKEAFSVKPLTPPPASSEDDFDEWDEEIIAPSEENPESTPTTANKPLIPKLSIKPFTKPESLTKAMGGIESSIGEVLGDLQGFVGKWRGEKPSSESPETVPDSEGFPNQNWRCIRTIAGHRDVINCVAIHPDGKSIAAGDGDNTVKLWGIPEGSEIRSLNGEDWFASMNAIAFSPDGGAIAAGIGEAVEVWDVAEGRKLHRFTRNSEAVYAVIFLNNGQQIIASDTRGSVAFWHRETGEELRRFNAHQGMIRALAISPDDRILATASDEGIIKLWQLQTGQEICVFKTHNDAVNAIAFSPDGQLLASGSTDMTLKLWQVNSGEELRTFMGHGGAIAAVAFSPDSEILISTSTDKTVKLWHRDTGELIRTLKGHSNGVTGIALTPDGKTLVSSSSDKTVMIWQRE
ncbi:WD40 repeat domain-containing protein [Oscillatoria acuminata]|uniref:WD40 repeat-containing protein n=1 Tax=Oscillatoria acuminata PCC 6304 TaxID=56110 RepID=K9TJ43_9CYAN|nr:WD40 repeat domain-containing protein [Oscillatoria acuminata]AFY82176.1 WD40 repeat-containing protein [Oscillatoria acuminata PCC 6304]